MQNKNQRFYNLLNKDIKDLNVVVLSLFCVLFLIGSGFFSYKITNSYALFSDAIKSEESIGLSVYYPTFDTSGANEPVLSENMIPVYYDETCDSNSGCWRKAYAPNTRKSYKWYNYDEKMWANSVTVTENTRNVYKEASPGVKINMDDILTMQVWIPRYKYKVWNYNKSGTVGSSPQEIQITFEEGTSTTGEITCTDNVQGTSDGTLTGTEPLYSEVCKLKSTNTECTDELCNNKTYTHPAFTFGDKELEGIWVGKFEVSSDINCTPVNNSKIETDCNLTSIRPLVKPDVTSWRGAMISVYENNIMAMNDSGNKYGFSLNDDTHMIKNMEYGAIAYFSHSKYGINKELSVNRNSEYITGCGPISGESSSSGIICNAYNTSLGKSASTTGNVYGIYDMSGSAIEYIIGNIINYDGLSMLSGKSGSTNNYSGYTGIVYDGGKYTYYTGDYAYPDDKYYDKYSFNINQNRRSIGKLGDSTKEVYTTSNTGWYGRYSIIIVSESPWFYRGGSFNSTSKNGFFESNATNGYAHINRSTHLVISQ